MSNFLTVFVDIKYVIDRENPDVKKVKRFYDTFYFCRVMMQEFFIANVGYIQHDFTLLRTT
jgi:hypothetical protein